ncbi:MAG TPA: AraC family transcriptional regulator [Candidatus Acidoferrales bacterium]|nr:AraC family transcriptional regulator [Candidatus Acidoferrales bacterium]
MDVLSEVLKVVKLEGAIYYNAEFTAPWSLRAPPSSVLAPHFAPGGGHVIIYHLLTEGRGFAGLGDGKRVPLTAGDVVIFPHGDSHIMGNGAEVEPVDQEGQLHRIFAQGVKLARAGGGGEVTKFVCGYMSCDPQVSRVFLAGLPAVFKVNIRDGAAGQWLESSIRFSVQEADASRAGGEAVLAKLSELLFVETLRRYMAEQPAEQTGWLAGARDPEVGKALALVHRHPARPWTIADLAREAGLSRSVLAERFRHYLGEPPISYLTRWRLQLGAQMLKSSSRSVAEVSAEVGYESEAAFNRAFKREYGVPPARFRSESRAGGKAPSSENADALRVGGQG